MERATRASAFHIFTGCVVVNCVKLSTGEKYGYT